MKTLGVEDHASALRRAFDASFAESTSDDAAATEDFLALRLAGHRYALRLANVARLVTIPKIVPVPTSRPTALGIAAVRGVLIAVHSLPALLAHPLPEAASHRWLVIVEAPDVLGLAFDELDGFLRLPRGTDGALSLGGVARPILDLNAVLALVKNGGPPPESGDR